MKTRIGRFGVAAALALSAVAGQASAQVTTEFTYQGRLDQSGNPSNGAFDFQFRCFDASAGGAQLGATLTFSDLNVVNGLFTVTLDFGALPDDELWIEVRVRPGASGGAYTLLTPRQKKTAAPFSLLATDIRLPLDKSLPSTGFANLLRLENTGDGRAAAFQTNAANTGSHTVRIDGVSENAHTLGVYGQDNGAAFFNAPGGTTQISTIDRGLLTNGNVLFQSFSSSGYDFTLDDGNGNPLLRLRDDARERVRLDIFDFGTTPANNFNQLQFFGVTGNQTMYLADDADGQGFFLSGGDLLIQNFADGAEVAVFGPFTTVLNSAAGSGDNAVALPTGAVNAFELSNEPGIAATQDDVGISITTTADTIIDSVTINAPSSGFVHVTATCQFLFNHVSGTTSNYEIGISTGASLPPNQDLAIVWPSGSGSGQTSVLPGVQAVFPVSAGLNTFNLVGRKLGSGAPTATINDRQIVALFVPTSYGTIDPALMAGPGGFAGGTDERVAQPFNPGLSASQVQAKAQAALAADNARMQRELAEARAQQAEMLARIEAIEKAQKGQARPSTINPPVEPMKGETAEVVGSGAE
jgi:hypothetical protein